MKSIRQVQTEIRENYPVIEPNQIWVARGSDRKISRRLRILAQMPEPTGFQEEGRAWIIEEKPSKMMSEIRIFKCPEFNLRYVFRLHGVVNAKA